MTVTIPITVPPLPRLPGDAGIRMDMIFSVSASHVLFGKQWVFLVTGNEDCLISYYGVNEQVERAVRSAERIAGITDGGDPC